MKRDALIGCLLGTAVGDALGLPYEGLSPRRASRILGPPVGYRFLFGRGMVSDDTEHTCMVAQSLIDAHGEVKRFQTALGWRFRFWLLRIPAGIGLATMRAIVRLWVGFSPERSGVNSAGNGPAMRASILGAAIDAPEVLRDFVRASTRITHTDPKAEYGALAVALASHFSRRQELLSPDQYLQALKQILGNEGDELVELLSNAASAAGDGVSTKKFADSMGLSNGVSGYVYHSVPVAIHAWFSSPRDFRNAVTSVIDCGGDTDTTAAIVGGIIGAGVGKTGIPCELVSHLLEWPLTVCWMEKLASQLETVVTTGCNDRSINLNTIGLLTRNLFFLIVVLYHGFRRLAPPY